MLCDWKAIGDDWNELQDKLTVIVDLELSRVEGEVQDTRLGEILMRLLADVLGQQVLGCPFSERAVPQG